MSKRLIKISIVATLYCLMILIDHWHKGLSAYFVLGIVFSMFADTLVDD